MKTITYFLKLYYKNITSYIKCCLIKNYIYADISIFIIITILYNMYFIHELSIFFLPRYHLHLIFII